jgi:hypothetical protein
MVVKAAKGAIPMFGLGKKKLDERMLGMISIELAMFMRWIEENRRRMLPPDQANEIARRILDRENFKFSEQELFHIVNLAIASDVDQIDGVREKTGFDRTIDGFCKSIGIPTP